MILILYNHWHVVDYRPKLLVEQALFKLSEETVSNQAAPSAVQPSTTLAENQTNFDSLNSLVKTSRATVHGVVTQVSPLL